MVNDSVFGSRLEARGLERVCGGSRLRLDIGTLLLCIVHEIERMAKICARLSDLLVHRPGAHLWNDFVLFFMTITLLPHLGGSVASGRSRGLGLLKLGRL